MNYKEHEVSRDHKSVLPPGGCGNIQKRPHSSQTQKSVRHTAKPPKRGLGAKINQTKNQNQNPSRIQGRIS